MRETQREIDTHTKDREAEGVQETSYIAGFEVVGITMNQRM